MSETGKVKWFSSRRGYGFIKRDTIPEGEDNHEIFCHYTSIKMDGFKTLLPDLRVKFDVETGRKDGTIEAKNVEIIPPEFAENADKQEKAE